MITIQNTHSRLGNNMFQIAAAIGVAANRLVMVGVFPDCLINEPFDHGMPIRPLAWEQHKEPIVKERYFHYEPIEYTPNMVLSGYFQSEKYFEHCKDAIRSAFTFKNSVQLAIQSKYGVHIAKYPQLVAIHVRRGDYLKFPDKHPPLSAEKYYVPAMELMEKKVKNPTFFIFSDDPDWCQENFERQDNVFFITDNKDYEDLYLMSLCQHFIIANSSFSWWGAWLAKTQDKIVIGPKKWFGPAYHYHDTKDVMPPDWVLM